MQSRQTGDMSKVNEMIRHCVTEIHHRHEGLAPCDNLCIIQGGNQGDGFIEARRRMIFEWSGLHCRANTAGLNARFNDLWSPTSLRAEIEKRVAGAADAASYDLRFDPTNAAAFLTPAGPFTELLSSATTAPATSST